MILLRTYVDMCLVFGSRIFIHDDFMFFATDTLCHYDKGGNNICADRFNGFLWISYVKHGSKRHIPIKGKDLFPNTPL